MSRVLTRVLLVVVALFVAVSLASAQDDGGKKKGKRGQGPFDPFRMVERLNLTDEQKAKVADVKKEFGDALAAAQKKAALTDDQRKAGQEAAAKAREAGKSREEVRQAVQDAQKLTDDQKKGRTEMMEIMGKIREKFNSFLTDEQKAKMKAGKKGKGKPKSETT
jgi:Spy/CpxP family protein refolding chaperone